MNAYPSDLRKKVIAAEEQGMSTAEVPRAFGVGLVAVKRYVKMVREEGSLRPKRNPGRRPTGGWPCLSSSTLRAGTST